MHKQLKRVVKQLRKSWAVNERTDTAEMSRRDEAEHTMTRRRECLVGAGMDPEQGERRTGEGAGAGRPKGAKYRFIRLAGRGHSPRNR